MPVGSLPVIQNQSIQIENGDIVNILVKLGPDDSDINLNKGIHISFNIGKPHLIEFLIDSGDAR